MNELIKTNYNIRNPIISGCELHEFLRVGMPYTDLFSRMCEYGFLDGVDLNSFKIERDEKEKVRNIVYMVDEHQLTSSMAKEICMIWCNAVNLSMLLMLIYFLSSVLLKGGE